MLAVSLLSRVSHMHRIDGLYRATHGPIDAKTLPHKSSNIKVEMFELCMILDLLFYFVTVCLDGRTLLSRVAVSSHRDASTPPPISRFSKNWRQVESENAFSNS